MSIAWLFQQTITEKIEFPKLWTTNGILISISNAVVPSWRKLGYLKIEAKIEGEFFTAQYKAIEFGNSQISIPFKEYRLSFEPVESLIILHPNIQIKIAEFNLNMYVSPAESARPETGEPIYSTVIPNSPDSNTPRFSIAPTRSRRSILITNKTNKVLFIKEGGINSLPTLAAADPFTSIAAGASYAVEDWSGEVSGLMAAKIAAGGKIIVKELPYVVVSA
jgi:hypothetical protein